MFDYVRGIRRSGYVGEVCIFFAVFSSVSNTQQNTNFIPKKCKPGDENQKKTKASKIRTLSQKNTNQAVKTKKKRQRQKKKTKVSFRALKSDNVVW